MGKRKRKRKNVFKTKKASPKEIHEIADYIFEDKHRCKAPDTSVSPSEIHNK